MWRRKNLCRQNQAIKLVMNFATCCNRNESNWRFDIVDFDDSNIPQQKSTSSTKYCLVVHVSTISIPKQYFKNLIFHQNSYCGRFLTAMLSPKIRTHQISVIFFADVIIKFLLMLVNFILLLLIDFILLKIKGFWNNVVNNDGTHGQTQYYALR